jgi:hypothetical protein
VTNEEKLRVIKAVLNVEYEPESPAAPAGSSGGGAAPGSGGGGGAPPGGHAAGARGGPLGGAGGSGCVLDRWAEMRQCSTVFELAGQDRAGLLSDVLDLLTHNGCDVCTAAVWTYNRRVAFVVSVVEAGAPVRDGGKVLRLKQLLMAMMDAGGNGLVEASIVKGLIHYERRLHQLMLKEEEKEWARVRERVLTAAGIPVPPLPSADGSNAGAADSAPAAPPRGSGGGGGGAAAGQQQRGGGGGSGPVGAEVMCVSSEPLEAAGGVDADGVPLVSPKYSKPQVRPGACGGSAPWAGPGLRRGRDRPLPALNRPPSRLQARSRPRRPALHPSRPLPPPQRSRSSTTPT